MRIVHTCLRYPPARGGAENYIRDLVNLGQDLPDHHDIRVLTSKMRTHGPVTELPPDSLLDDPIYIQRLHYLRTPFISYPQLQALPYYLNHHKPDLIHTYGYWYQPADTSAKFAHAHKIPFIFHPIYYTNKVRHKPIWRLYDRTIGRRTFAAADITVVISPYEQSLIKRNNYPVKQFFLLPPPINTQLFSPTNQSNPYRALGLNNQDSILLSVGRIARSKGLQDIIPILPQLNSRVHLVIIGEDFGYQATLSRLIHSLGLSARVHFLNNVSDTDLPAYYQYADIFVHPSNYEAFGIVLTEASAAGLPIVARHTSAIPFACPHEVSGLLFRDSNELVHHLITLLDNLNLRQKYGTQGRQYVNQTFDTKIIQKKLAELYATARS